jgi:(p)ppGpp synthase/HD superfamily hydrolase
LLHDTIEDTEADPRRSGVEVRGRDADLVEGVTKLKLEIQPKKQRARTCRNSSGHVARRARVLVKLADRLHNMRT